jgi:hypothetical protein
MALVLKDRVKETTTTTGTGTYTLAGAVTGFQSFSVIGNANTTYYAATNGTDWEVGIGTYTASGTTLSRDTILESSNSNNAVNWGAGSKDIFVTYPAERSVYLIGDGSDVAQTSYGAITADSIALTTGTISTAPASDTDIANKLYVDNLVASGIHFHEPVRVESPINLNATYNNGTSGVGATLTNAGSQTALVIDGITLSVSDRVLIYTQTDQTQNGIYVVSNVGSVSTNWVLTRATDADSYGLASPDTLGEGSTVFVQQGDTGAGETYLCNTVGTITFGTTNITFVQISSVQVYSAGTGLTLTGTQFSVTTNGITDTLIRQSGALSVVGRSANSTGNVGDISAGTDNQVLRRSGTSLGFGAVNLASSDAVTGDLPFSNLAQGSALSVLGVTGNATADNASIAAGTDHQVLRRSGTSVAFGAVNLAQSAAVTGTLPVGNGGTGQTSYTDGQLLIGNTSGNTLAKGTLTAGTGISITNGAGSITVAATNNGTVTSVSGTGTVNGITLTGTVTSSGNLTLGGTLSNVSLSTQVTGTLPVGNGGTGITSFGAGVATWLGTPSSANLAAAVTDETGSGSLVFATSPTLVTPIIGVATATSINKVAITAPATSATLTIANGKTLTANNSLTLAGTDATTMTFPGTSQTIAGLGLAQTFTAAQTFRAANAIRSEAASTQDAVVIAGRAGGSSSYAITLTPATLAASRTLTLPEPGSNETLGYINTPIISQSAAYTLVLTDAGKTILHPDSDNNARTFTIPANGSVAYPVGTVITFVNMKNTLTIAITTDTMYLAGPGTTGSRTLAEYGVATAVKLTSTTWLISGNGLT